MPVRCRSLNSSRRTRQDVTERLFVSLAFFVWFGPRRMERGSCSVAEPLLGRRGSCLISLQKSIRVEEFGVTVLNSNNCLK